MSTSPPTVWPRLLMAVVVAALLAALWAGLQRLGWRLPALTPQLAGAHGPLMVSGFLGTLVALERAVALRARWCYSAPALSAAGALALLTGLPVAVGAALLTLGSVALVAVSAAMVRRHPARHVVTMAAGAVALLGGNGLWLAGRPIFHAAYWWAAFLVLVIAGERLELSRVLRPTRTAARLFTLAVGLLGGGLLLSLLRYGDGMRLASVGSVALALWLARYDLARRNVRRRGLTRYIAVNLLVGYGWLALSGVLGIVSGPLVAGPRYDAWLHALFLGFVFGMIFAHAPIILPSVLGIDVPYRSILYLPPLLLSSSLLLRIAGDLTFNLPLRQWGGLVNVVAVLLFAALLLGSALAARRPAA